MEKTRNVARSLSRMADDFVLAIVLLKKRDCMNLSMPFLHAHALELSAKAALLHFGADVEPTHQIRDMLALLGDKIDGLPELLPSDEAFARYRELWLADRGSTCYELSWIPSPDVLEE